MEVKGYREPTLRIAGGTPDFFAYVVMGDTDHAGYIKKVRVSTSNAVPFLEASWKKVQDGDQLLKEVRVPYEYAKRGWFLLDRAYELEGNEHGRKQWHAFQAACRAGRAFPARGPDGKIKDSRIVPGFPDELLPKAVRDRFEMRDPTLTAWEPEMPEPKVASKAKG